MFMRKPIGVLLRPVLALLLAAGSAGLLHAQANKWKFVVVGDTRGPSASAPINTNILQELAVAITNEDPVFLLVPGDLVYAGDLSSFMGWTNIMAPVYQAGIGVYPVMGNHDTSDVTSYRAVFGDQLPDNGPAAELERTYFLTCSNVLVLALDNYVTAHRVNQGWIDAVLGTNNQLHVFAMGHEPAFKANHTDCLDDYPIDRDAFWQSLRNVQGRAYFCGHDHFFDHLRAGDGDDNPANDIHQFITGGGGAPFHTSYAYDGINGPWLPVNIAHDMTNGYLRVEIESSKVTMTYVHRTTPGVYVDTADVFSYTLQPRLASSWDAGQLSLKWRGGGQLQAAPEVSGPFTNVPGATASYVVTNFTESSQYFRVCQP
jgi:hypothetical protein